MSKTRALILAVAALVIGGVIGGWGVFRFGVRFTSDLATSTMAAQATTTVRTLDCLRAGNTNGAIKLLESDLDGALIGLGASIPDIPPSRHDPLYLKAVQLARDYRAKFPRTDNPPEVTEAITRTFNLLDEKSGH